MAFPKFQTKEVLNKVLNTAETALQVDIISGAEYAEDSGHSSTDTGNFILGVRNNTLGALGDENGDYVPFQMNALGALYVEVASSSVDDSIFVDNAGFTLATSKVNVAGGVYQSSTPGTLNDNDAGAILLNSTAGQMVELMASSAAIGSVSVSNLLADGHAVTIDNLASNEVYVRGSGTAGTADGGVVTVQGIASGVAQPVSGTFWQTTQQVSISDTSFAVADGNALGEGVLVQGDDGSDRKNIHVDATTGDVQVDVTDIVPGVAAASLGKAEDAEHGSGDTGVAVLAVRNDVLEALAGTDGDYSVLQVNKTGALNVTETVGHLGAHYENTTGTIDSLKIVAFQFLEDTKFSVLTPATSAYIGNTSSGGEDVPNDEVFPQGMTIFGRWTAFTLVSGGRVIAYLGDW